MTLCRTCLKTPADKNILELEKDINEDNKNYSDIMVFCLDIKITQDSKITKNLCDSCYEKIISIYKFKAQSLKNDVYLKSLDPAHSGDGQQLSTNIDGDKVENKTVLENDEYNLVENCMKVELKVEDANIIENVKIESEYEETSEDITDDSDDDDTDDSDLSDDEVSDEKPDPINYKEIWAIWDKFKKKAPKKKRSTKKKGKPANKNVPQGRQVCEDCGMSVLDIKAHALTHQPREKRQMLKCKACPKMFISRGGRRRHYKIRHLGMKAKCDICDKEVVHLAVHKMQVHDPAAMPFECTTCGRRFVSKPALETHTTSHTLVAAFDCEICQKKFRSKSQLTTHIRCVHEKEKNNVCELCNKGFFCKSALREHMLTHGNERIYQCSACAMSFMTKNSLRKHSLVHSDIKKYKCQFCDMSFKISASLKLHMITHTKEKRYSCQFCGKAFGRPDSCRRHEAGHRRPADADAPHNNLLLL